MEADATIKFRNGKCVSGVILDLVDDETIIDGLAFVPNECLELYRNTESDQLIVRLESDNVESISLIMK